MRITAPRRLTVSKGRGHSTVQRGKLALGNERDEREKETEEDAGFEQGARRRHLLVVVVVVAEVFAFVYAGEEAGGIFLLFLLFVHI